MTEIQIAERPDLVSHKVFVSGLHTGSACHLSSPPPQHYISIQLSAQPSILSLPARHISDVIVVEISSVDTQVMFSNSSSQRLIAGLTQQNYSNGSIHCTDLSMK